MEDRIQILIVEDEALIAHNLKLTLEDFGYEVVKVCYDYYTALTAISTFAFDVLLLDINLGSHTTNTGLDIAAQLSNLKIVPFIFLTAFSDRDTIKKATKLKPSAYLVKPVNEATLFATIQTAIVNFTQNKEAVLPGEEAESPDFFFSKIGKKIVKVHWKDVVMMVSEKNYVRIVTKEDNKEYLIRGSLTQVQKNMLPVSFTATFTKVNRSVIVLKSSIIEFKEMNVITKHGVFLSTKEIIKELLEN